VMRVPRHVSGFREPRPAILAHGSVKPVTPRSIVTAAASAIPLEAYAFASGTINIW
jgi:hypothetical protein